MKNFPFSLKVKMVYVITKGPDGKIVKRELKNSDYVVVNRQPTLHKDSMLKYEPKSQDEEMLQPIEDPTEAQIESLKDYVKDRFEELKKIVEPRVYFDIECYSSDHKDMPELID